MALRRTGTSCTSRLRKVEVRDCALVVSAVLSATLLLYIHLLDLHQQTTISSPAPPSGPLPLHHLLFSIASSSASIHSRASYIRVWHAPISRLNTTFLFLDRPPPQPQPAASLPPIIISPNASSRHIGHRIARVVRDAVALDVPGIYWYVFGDDDTLLFTENIARILSKYDHNQWYYIGCNSESYEQNDKFYFDMAFGGGGYAISAPLARVLAQVLDSCLNRNAHLYGSDARIFSCLAELGVQLTVEQGFHQVDVRGNLHGLLSAHPLSLMASLHHIDAVDPIFSFMSRTESLEHLFKAVSLDPARIFQQTVCYDANSLITVSASWGYAVEIYEGNQHLPELLSFQRSFRPWKRGKNVASSRFMFNMREYPNDPCKRPVVFFLHSAVRDTDGVWTNYTRHEARNCTRAKVIEKFKVVRVFSPVVRFDMEQMKAPRRHCCVISSSSDEDITIQIRNCGIFELIAMRG
ncbi:uncharacterized protein LOC127258310 isoform X1 [Andrographis paniculata]|uniref:uncharacterized protein LOC127258310 isoform X1 n=1 Tax=Andrographis paniculata TaxID=175694 RepID=UPI0021E6DC5D|nr:uncharacterized protein LOC127258310 isoform X1 [Andrographis paniculata]